MRRTVQTYNKDSFYEDTIKWLKKKRGIARTVIALRQTREDTREWYRVEEQRYTDVIDLLNSYREALEPPCWRTDGQ